MGCLQVGASKRTKVLVAAMDVGDLNHGRRQHRGSLTYETSQGGGLFQKNVHNRVFFRANPVLPIKLKYLSELYS